MFYFFLILFILSAFIIFINKNNFFKILIAYECLTLFSIFLFSSLSLLDFENIIIIIMSIIVISTVDVVIGITFIIYFSQS